jgi:hypothetical protein
MNVISTEMNLSIFWFTDCGANDEEFHISIKKLIDLQSALNIYFLNPNMLCFYWKSDNFCVYKHGGMYYGELLSYLYKVFNCGRLWKKRKYDAVSMY